MKLIKEMSLGELAAFVNTQIKKNGIDCVLTGGACVSIYTENRYQSFDLDFETVKILAAMDVDVAMATHIMEKSTAKQNIIEATTSSVELLATLINQGGDILDFIDTRDVELISDVKWGVTNRKFSIALLYNNCPVIILRLPYTPTGHIATN